MKKYNWLLLFSIIFYFFLSLTSGILLFHQEEKQSHVYRVEMNRIKKEFTEIHSIEKVKMSDYTYIKKIVFLDASMMNETTITHFFKEQNNFSILIEPWYQEGKFLGYLKFMYQVPGNPTFLSLILLEGSLFLLELFVLFLLVYLKRRVIHPFHRLSELPQQLAKGRLKGEVKIEKSQYFKNFLCGISQLKDTLDVSKHRQLELMKEKKRILLSLSHDIKTPLNLIKLYAKALDENVYTKKEEKQHALYQIGKKTIEIERYVDTITKSSTEELVDLPVEMGEFYLSDLLKKVFVVYQDQCDIRNIDLIVANYKDRIIKGDLNRSQEVMENLFENAIKYGDGKRIEISFREEDYCQLITIFNTGGNVTDNEFNHLFDTFFRGSNATGKQGSGLGLSICQELMRKMDGTIYAEQKEDGILFTLVFR